MVRGITLRCAGLVILSAPVALSPAHVGDGRSAETGPYEVDFYRDVRPILSDHCFGCHGPDEETREGELRLDLHEEVLADRGGYAAVVPGNTGDSELLLRIFDDLDPMPPEEDGDPLTAEEKDVLRRWVEEGADWPEHWAFTPPTRPPLPDLTDETWVRGDIDRFVLTRLLEAGLEPAPETIPEAWLRRASFDLTGLPPTPEELDTFLADESSDAYERQVDRLLASPRYGERQAQDWLDLARYADSNGNQFDEPRSNWKWREWVIEAFNANMPFDQFTVEQLAGDLLPDPTQSQLVATGFNRNNPTDTDGPSEKDEYRTEYVIDRVHTTATTFMGLTLACAQCHDHKFDPISQEDFYSFYSFFNDVAERDIDFGNPRPRMRVPDPDQAPLLLDLDERIAELEERLEAEDTHVDRAQREWEQEVLERLGSPVEWTALDPQGMLSRNGAILQRLDDGSILATGPAPVKDTYDLVVQPGPGTIEALRLEVLPNDEREDDASGRAEDGTFRLTGLMLRDGSLSDGSESPLVYVSLAQADLNQGREDAVDPEEGAASPGGIEGALVYESDDDDDDDDGGFRFGRGGWTIVGPDVARPHEAVLIPLEPLQLNEASILKITMQQTSGGKARSLIGRFRWSATDDPSLRAQLLAMAPKLWSTLGPWPATDAATAFETAFAVEEDIEANALDRKKRFPEPPEPKDEEEEEEKSGSKGGGFGPGGPGGPGGFGGAERVAAAKKSEGEPKNPDASAAKSEAGAKKPEDDTTRTGGDGRSTPGDGEEDGQKETEGRGEDVGKADGEQSRDPGTAGEKPANAEGGPGRADAKPDDEPKAEAKREDEEEPPPAPQEFFGFGGRRDRGPREIQWEEKRGWSDGSRQSLEIETGAYYLARKIVCERPAVASIRLDGPKGVKVWLNGKVVFEDAPPPPAPRRSEEDDDDDDDDDDFDFDFESFFRDRDRSARRVRLGFRAGENELVVKAVFEAQPSRGGRGGGNRFSRRGSGSSVTFDLTPEGDATLSYEVAQALRRSAQLEGLTSTTIPTADDTPRPSTLVKPVPGVQVIGAPAADLAPAAQRAAVIRDHYREYVSPTGRALRAELARLEDERDDFADDIPEAMVMADREEHRQAYVFVRGDWRKRGPDVGTATPAALPPMAPELPRNRLGLARWIVSGEHPLTARVVVNRLWQQYFGTGLVATAEDFGVRAETPSHPELLDWLAAEFVEGGWDMKAMHRHIALSATYRQTATITPEKLELDPDNRLLSHGPRVRLSAEMIRDNALFTSGLLVEDLGGPSVRPYQAKGVWSEVGGGRDWRKDSGEKQYRRGLYVYWKRRVPYPSMVTFDASKGETCTVRRPETNTPMQALVLLNNPVFVEASRVLGQRLLGAEGDDAAKLALGFRMCTSRPPSEVELAVLTELLAELRTSYSDDLEGAEALLEVGDSEADEELDARELAAWAQVASALLNLDAAIHKG